MNLSEKLFFYGVSAFCLTIGITMLSLIAMLVSAEMGWSWPLTLITGVGLGCAATRIVRMKASQPVVFWGLVLGAIAWVVAAHFVNTPGVIGIVSIIVLVAVPGIVICRYVWLIGIAMMLLPIPVSIALYPTSRQLVCQKVAAPVGIADCYVSLKRNALWLNYRNAPWLNYRQEYQQIREAKVLVVNAKSSGQPGTGKRLSNPIMVQRYPLYLMNRSWRSEKVGVVMPKQNVAENVAARINQFLKSSDRSLSINLMDIAWEPNSDGFGGGSHLASQRDYVLMSAYQILMSIGCGFVFFVKTYNRESNVDGEA